jgi:hypothetical protein
VRADLMMPNYAASFNLPCIMLGMDPNFSLAIDGSSSSDTHAPIEISGDLPKNYYLYDTKPFSFKAKGDKEIVHAT